MNVRSSIRYTIGLGAVGICVAVGVAIVRRGAPAYEGSGSAAEIEQPKTARIEQPEAAEQPATVDTDRKLVATS